MVFVRRESRWQRSESSDEKADPTTYIFDIYYGGNQCTPAVGLGEHYPNLNGVHPTKHILESPVENAAQPKSISEIQSTGFADPKLRMHMEPFSGMRSGEDCVRDCMIEAATVANVTYGEPDCQKFLGKPCHELDPRGYLCSRANPIAASITFCIS